MPFFCILKGLSNTCKQKKMLCHIHLNLIQEIYHLLSPNYPSAVISSFNYLYQRDLNVHIRSGNSHEETRKLRQTWWHPLKACYQFLRGIVHQ